MKFTERRQVRASLATVTILSTSLIGCGASGDAATGAATSTATSTQATGAAAFDADLYRSAEVGNRSGVQYRLDAGADINAANPANGWTALHAAAYNGHKKLVAYLLTRGANANAPDKDGNTPLHLAASQSHGDTTAALMGATDQTRRNSAGKTPREVANPKVAFYFPQA